MAEISQEHRANVGRVCARTAAAVASCQLPVANCNAVSTENAENGAKFCYGERPRLFATDSTDYTDGNGNGHGAKVLL